ncbi:inactive protein kinase SELMODRAFT_444075 [Rhodamnia argentea]|uniref:Inactive protein kinase SELMODRAFT_444075 n=1 Tax=Rhodamnia argentea TaxID=178133 RepID=A0ABM3HS14_9MYRT|nr:inactive protein kinase SELMODRAFT_444075 [Rhodamnia argentea]
MSQHQKQGKPEKETADVGESVVVAVKASREIPKTALVWALTHVVQPGNCILLLVVVPQQNSGRRLWGFPRFAGDCANGNSKYYSGSSAEQKSDITDSCSQMILQLHNVYNPNKINVQIRIVSGSPCGAVAAEAKKAQASWVVLDKQLKHEEKQCLEELQCNIVVMRRSQPKVLRLNLVGSLKKESEHAGASTSEMDRALHKHHSGKSDASNSIRGPAVTPNSSPESGTVFTNTEVGTSSVSSSDPGTSPFFTSEMTREIRKQELMSIEESKNLDQCTSDSESETQSLSSTSLRFDSWMSEVLSSHCPPTRCFQEDSVGVRANIKAHTPVGKTSPNKFSQQDGKVDIRVPNCGNDLEYGGNVREATSVSRHAPPGPPPLCSICQHKAPAFGKPPKWFSYAELELATGGFSKANFLAEGGFGSVHRGVLPDGQAVAVKQHKLASSQGDQEFCSEVEVLSCAQHRNVVMLIGICVEDNRRLLVYEYICNGSLDSHLYGCHQEPLEWSSRQKIAIGAARGLRYLHEECRVGCIIHRDMRPNNILVTHDFEPLVGDFGLARWQPDGDISVETRVLGTFGYLAPEYAQTGHITEKADVFSFGVVLVELVTGRKAVDLNRPKGQQCLAEWARPLLEEYAIHELIDPRLGDQFSEQEVYCMLHAASLCIRRDPESRPRMSQVLRILEGDGHIDTNYMSISGVDVGSHSGRIRNEQQYHSGPLLDETRQAFTRRHSLQTLGTSFRERERARRRSYGEAL